MNKKRIISTLILTMVLTSMSFAGRNQKVFAKEQTTSSILNENGGKIDTPIIQNVYNKPEYYKNGLPSRIELDKKKYDSESVVLDVKFPYPVYIGENAIYKSTIPYDDLKGILNKKLDTAEDVSNGEERDEFLLFMCQLDDSYRGREDITEKIYLSKQPSKSDYPEWMNAKPPAISIFDLENLKVKSYINRDNEVVRNFADIVPGYSTDSIEKSVIPAGQTAFSIVLEKDSPLINDIKVERTRFFKILNEGTVEPNKSKELRYTAVTGVTETEAFSIAKTTGASTSFEGGGTFNGLSGKFTQSLSRSLQKTFSTSYSLTESKDETNVERFESDGSSRRVGVYVYGEEYKSLPKFNIDVKLEYPFLYPTTSSSLYERFIQTLDIANPDGKILPLKNIVSINYLSNDGSFVNGLLGTDIEDFKHLQGSKPVYNSNDKSFTVNDSVFNLIINNVQEEGYYILNTNLKKEVNEDVRIYTNNKDEYALHLGPNAPSNSTEINNHAFAKVYLNKGRNNVPIITKGEFKLYGIELKKYEEENDQTNDRTEVTNNNKINEENSKIETDSNKETKAISDKTKTTDNKETKIETTSNKGTEKIDEVTNIIDSLKTFFWW